MIVARSDAHLLRCVQRAYLYFARAGDFGEPPYSDDVLDRMDFDPDRITALLGVLPTGSYRRGDPHPRLPNRRRHFSGWAYGLTREDTFDAEEVVVRLLDAIEPFADRILDTCGALGLEGGIQVVVEMEGYHDRDGHALVSTADINYRANTLQRLARLGLSVDHDQYVHITPATDAPAAE